MFQTLSEVEPWYGCPGRVEHHPTADGLCHCRYDPHATCGFRAPGDASEWVRLDDDDMGCPCGSELPRVPLACNWRIACDPACEEDGCDLSDCVAAARDRGACPFGGAVVLREVKVEPVPDLARRRPGLLGRDADAEPPREAA